MKRAYLGLLIIAIVSQFACAAESSGVKVDVLANYIELGWKCFAQLSRWKTRNHYFENCHCA